MKKPNYEFNGKVYKDYLRRRTIMEKIRSWWNLNWFNVVEYFHFW